MNNRELAKIFYEMAQYMKMEEIDFKPFAYERAGASIEALEQDVEEIYKEGGVAGLEKISGVGKNIARKIEEYISTGNIKTYQRLKKKTPVNLEELVNIEGVGVKKVKILYRKLKIKNLKDLEKAAKAHKIAPLFGFGEKTEKNILQGIKFLKRSKGRFLLGEILPHVREIIERLKSLEEVEQISTAGSLRRMKETIGDADILVVSGKPSSVMDFFCSLPEVVKIWSKGNTKSSVRMENSFGHVRNKISNGVDIDIRVVAKESYGSALQYFTGSKEHNIITRKIAIAKKLKLNEYGIFQGKKMIAGKTEKEIYKILGMDWIPPEMRENQGEIELALKKKLPRIIDYKDIKGDLHCHSNWDGGVNSILEIAETAMEMSYEYLGISDHTKFLRIENGLDERQLSQQRKEIEKINAKIQNSNVKSSSKSKFQILQGCETNILNNGSVDIKDEALKKLDYVIAGVHSSFKMSKEKMTERIIRAMKNPHIKIISHPTGRILKKREEYQIDFDRILRAAKQTETILEINAYPVRLDLNDKNIRRAKRAGVKMIINTDSHQKNQLRFIEFGIAQARRGWAEKKDIINTQPLQKLLKFLE